MRFLTLVLALATTLSGGTTGAQQVPQPPARTKGQGDPHAASAAPPPSTASAIERGSPGGNRNVRADSQAAKEKAAYRPLEELAAQRILVLPVQSVIFADSLGWGSQISSVRSYLQSLDDEISYTLTDRGLDGKWILSDAVVRSAKRNSDFAPDPHAIDMRQLRPGAKTDEFLLREPLASQLRSLIALTDARFVLIPVEMRVTDLPAPKGANASGANPNGPPRAYGILHVVVVDARRSQLQWVGDVTGAPLASFSPALAADLASRLGDLIAPSN